MERKVRETENIKLLEQALSLLKVNKEILSYSCNRSFSYGRGENINLNIEFEVPYDVSFNFESSTSRSDDSKCTSSKPTTTNDDVKVYTSTITPSSETSIPPESCQDVKDDDVMKNNANYQALNTLSQSQKNVYVEVIVYIRTYVQNNKDEGFFDRFDIELNPFKISPRGIIKTVLPDRDPIKVMEDGMCFTRNEFDCVRDNEKQLNWITCYPYEMDMSLVKIYGSTSLNDFKMSFIIDDKTKV